MNKLILTAIVLVSSLTSSCATLEERLAQRVGCDHKKLSVQRQINAPGFQEYRFTCEGQKHLCRDYPFHRTCDLDDGKEKPDGKSKDAKKKKSK